MDKMSEEGRPSWLRDEDADMAVWRVGYSLVVFVYYGEIIDNSIERSSFGSPLPQEVPTQIGHVYFRVSVKHGAVTDNETDGSFVDFFRVFRIWDNRSGADPKHKDQNLELDGKWFYNIII